MDHWGGGCVHGGHPVFPYAGIGGVGDAWDLDANGGKVAITLTQEMLDAAYVQQWGGGTFVLNGDNVKCTMITLL